MCFRCEHRRAKMRTILNRISAVTVMFSVLGKFYTESSRSEKEWRPWSLRKVDCAQLKQIRSQSDLVVEGLGFRLRFAHHCCLLTSAAVSVSCRHRYNGEATPGVSHSTAEAGQASGRAEARSLRRRTTSKNGQLSPRFINIQQMTLSRSRAQIWPSFRAIS